MNSGPISKAQPIIINTLFSLPFLPQNSNHENPSPKTPPFIFSLKFTPILIMGRKSDPTMKNKGILYEGGSSAHRQTPQNPSESTALIPIPANPQNAYPFNARMRMTATMKEREAKMKDFKVLTPIFPDIDILHTLGVLDEVKNYFVPNGFGFVFMDEPPSVFMNVVREFAYSFAPTWREVEKNRSAFKVLEKHVVEWKFRLGGETFRYSRQDLLRVFALPDIEIFPYVRKTVLNDFWKMISGTESDYVPAQSATQIMLPVWKFVHRFIATCVHLRKDEGRWVSKADLELMCCFYNRIRFDALTIITQSLEEASFPSFRGTYLGGGHLITLLALDAGFSLDPDYAIPIRFLGEEELIRRGFIKVIRLENGSSRYYLVGRDPIPERKASRGSSSRGPTIPPSTQDATQYPPTIDGLAAQLNTLTTYTRSGFEWQGDMFQELFTHLGCEGYKPPPPFPSWQGSTSGTKGHDEEVPDSEDDTSADDMDEDQDASASF